MTASISNISLTLTQTVQQRVLRVVEVGYAYTLSYETDPGRKASAVPFNVEIDILGDDLLSDDLLAAAVDQHSVDCPADSSVRVARTLTVAQGLLDEDIGDDEIKLRIRLTHDGHPETPVEAISPIVKGKF